MNADSVSEKLFFTTCRIEAASTDKSWVGTGFVYAVDTAAGFVHLVVTNRHVLLGAETVTVRFVGRADDGKPQLGRATEVTLLNFDEEIWVGHPNSEVDVAVMPLAQVLEDMSTRGAQPFFTAVTPEVCQGIGSNHRFDAIEDVSFVGYPAGLFDQVNFLPVVRRGSTATPIEVDYEGLPAFLIDAAVYPGSSGSPVFVVDRGFYSDRLGQEVTVGSRVVCLGVVAAVHTQETEAALSLLPASVIAKFHQPIGLGIVYKATCFDECVQILLDRAGIQRGASALAFQEGDCLMSS